MNTGKIIEDEFGSFEDEVLNAGWLPPPADIQAPAPVRSCGSAAADIDTDAFLNTIYSNQE